MLPNLSLYLVAITQYMMELQTVLSTTSAKETNKICELLCIVYVWMSSKGCQIELSTYQNPGNIRNVGNANPTRLKACSKTIAIYF